MVVVIPGICTCRYQLVPNPVFRQPVLVAIREAGARVALRWTYFSTHQNETEFREVTATR